MQEAWRRCSGLCGRTLFRWARDTRRAAANWLGYLAAPWNCPRLTYSDPETDDRAVRIGTACPNCACEKISVGRYGSPGKVRGHEALHSILIAPGDLKNDQIAITVITHAERKGMSVLRENASNEEFQMIIRTRIRDATKQRFHGVATVGCARIRQLAAKEQSEQRRRGDRLYCVLDTDMNGLPNHADVFATVPRPHTTSGHKAAWRKEREKLLALSKMSPMRRRFVRERSIRDHPQFHGPTLRSPRSVTYYSQITHFCAAFISPISSDISAAQKLEASKPFNSLDRVRMILHHQFARTGGCCVGHRRCAIFTATTANGRKYYGLFDLMAAARRRELLDLPAKAVHQRALLRCTKSLVAPSVPVQSEQSEHSTGSLRAEPLHDYTT